MKKHILVISQYFYPEQFRINDICREWVKQGDEVTVVTGIPNYPQGKFYKGYGLWKQRKTEYEGVHIVRLPIVPRGSKGITMAINYLSFVVSGFFWKLFTNIKADKVFIFEVSPMTQALVGVWYAKRRKIPCYIYVQDLWPENVEIVTGIQNKVIIGTIDRMVNYIYRNCCKIFATSPSFVERIAQREPERDKIIYWPQYAEEFYHPAERQELADLKADGIFRIVFTGNIGYAQGLELLPKAAKLLKNQGLRCEFCIIGDGRYLEEFKKIIYQEDVEEYFLLLGRKQPEEIPLYLAHCDVAFLSFADNALFEMTIPAKLQSYMACGIPILAAASGETKRIIDEAEAGIVCELGNAEQVCDAVRRFLAMPQEEICIMRENVLHYFKEFFSKGKLWKLLEEYMEEGETEYGGAEQK